MTERSRAEWALFFATFLWAGTFVVVKVGLNDLSPFLLVSIRFSAASLLFLPFSFRAISRLDRTVLWKGLLLGLFIFLGFILQTVGLTYTTASKSAFITGMLVIFTPFFQLLLLKRPPRWGSLVGTFLVSVGLWFLTAPGGEGVNRGDLLTLFCAIVFSLQIVSLDLISKRHDPVQVTFLAMSVPALFGWLALPLFERPLFRPTAAAFLTLSYTVLFATVITTYVQTRYQRETTPTRAALIYTLEPVWAAILGFIFLDEHFGAEEFLGGGMIIAGILFSELQETAAVSLRRCRGSRHPLNKRL